MVGWCFKGKPRVGKRERHNDVDGTQVVASITAFLACQLLLSLLFLVVVVRVVCVVVVDVDVVKVVVVLVQPAVVQL